MQGCTISVWVHLEFRSKMIHSSWHFFWKGYLNILLVCFRIRNISSGVLHLKVSLNPMNQFHLQVNLLSSHSQCIGNFGRVNKFRQILFYLQKLPDLVILYTKYCIGNILWYFFILIKCSSSICWIYFFDFYLRMIHNFDANWNVINENWWSNFGKRNTPHPL